MTYLLIYWSFHCHIPLRVGWSLICCITGLMAFLHFNLPLTQLRLKQFLHRSLLTTSFHLNFTLTQEVGPSTTKFIIFFVHNVSSILLHMSTSLICYRSSLLLSSSSECCCFIFTPHIYWIIAWSLILVCDKAPVDMGHGSLT